MKFINWASELPSDFGEQTFDKQNDIVENIIKEKTGNCWLDDYPFVEDIKENDLPESLLKHLCCFYDDYAIEIIEKYKNDEFTILALNCRAEFSEDFLMNVLNYLTDSVIPAFEKYLDDFVDEIDLLEILEFDKLPEEVLEHIYYSDGNYIYGDIKGYYGDIVKHPSLENGFIIREIADYFLKLDDDSVFDNKEYLRDCLAKNQYLPEDVEKALRKEAEELLRHIFAQFKSPRIYHGWKLEMATYILEHRFVPNDLKEEVRAWLNQQ